MTVTERDLKILGFLWRWKVASTSVIYAKYFAKVHPMIPYRRLEMLRRKGLIENHLLVHNSSVWTLATKGFNLIKDRLPQLKEVGFKSENIKHDLMVTAFHLGDFLVKRPQTIQFCSEQELRRFHPEMLPGWVPKSEIHRPDGYWYILSNKKPQTIAVEVELSRKSKSELEAPKRFYETEKLVDQAIWLASTAGHAETLHRILELASQRTGCHQFALEQDFKKSGWDVKIILGSEKGKSVRQLLSPAQTPGATMPVPLLLPRFTHLFLDFRKRRMLPQS